VSNQLQTLPLSGKAGERERAKAPCAEGNRWGLGAEALRTSGSGINFIIFIISFVFIISK
jgi:hypothetical protein